MKRALRAGTLLFLLGAPAVGGVASAQPPPGYVVVEGAFINGSGIGTSRPGMSAASCAAACDAEPRCLSFEMYSGGTCSLNAADRRTRPDILTRSDRYTYYEKVARSASPTGTAAEPVFVYQNCSRGPDACTLGVADGAYATPGNARHREGWRRLPDEGPFSSHPAAWARVCRLHAPPSREAPAITTGEVDCAALGVPLRGARPAAGPGLGGYTVVDGAFINGSGIGQARPGQTAESCAAACDAEPRCLSFELYDGALCSLNTASRRTRADILSRSPRYRYYERRGPR